MNQEQALAILKTGANVFLTGEPGAGKTHTVNRYVSYLRAHGIEPALTASTGIAATHIGGMTIHSWSGIGIAESLSKYDLDRISSNERIYLRLTKAKVLIIDEVSMLDARTLDMVDAVCRATRRNDAPFGGLQTVLVGDFFQLPPVARDGRTATFAFRAEAWEKMRPVTCYLSGQYRQDDQAFLSVLSAIRCDGVDDDHYSCLQERISVAGEAPKDVVKLFSHNVDVDRINEQQLAKLGGKAHSFGMKKHGPAALVESLLRGCLSPELLTLKMGAAVMFTRNNPQAGFVNGTLGTVVSFDKDTGHPVVKTRDGAIIRAEPMEWVIGDQGKALATLGQVPLRLAWAMTIHKSQGMSLDAALIDLGSAFEYGQGYVALSRVRRMSGLFLLGCNERATQVHPEVLTQDRAFRAASDAAIAHLDTLSSEQMTERAERFLKASGGTLEEKLPAVAEKPKESFVAKARADKPKAFKRWKEDEEKVLKEMFAAGESIEVIMERLGRQRGGITARLKKLGLIEE